MGKIPEFLQYRGLDWVKGKVMLLETDEVGVFAHLIGQVHANGGAVRNDKYLPKIIHAKADVFNRAIKACEDLDIIRIEDGYIHIKFIDQQIAAYEEQRSRSAEFGAQGGKAKSNKAPLGGVEPPLAGVGAPLGGVEPPLGTQGVPCKNKIKEKKNKINNKYPAHAHTREETQESIYPESVEEVIALSQEPTCANPMTKEQAQAYYDYRTSTGWVNSNGIPIRKVEADIACWMRREKERIHRQVRPVVQEEGLDAAAIGYMNAKYIPGTARRPPPFEPVKRKVVPAEQYEAAVAEERAERERKAKEEATK